MPKDYQRLFDEKSVSSIEKKFRREAAINFQNIKADLPFTEQRVGYYLGCREIWADESLRQEMTEVMIALNSNAKKKEHLSCDAVLKKLMDNCDTVIKRLIKIGILKEEPLPNPAKHFFSCFSQCFPKTEKSIVDLEFLKFVFYSEDEYKNLIGVKINFAPLKMVSINVNGREVVASFPEPAKKSCCGII